MSRVSEQPVDRITIPLLQRWKQDGRRLVMTTAYDAVAAPIPDPSIDISLVGDSGGNVCLGFENTPPVSVAMMNHHLEAAVRSKPRALLVADMSFLSFHVSVEETIRNAGGFLQRGAAAARLEGGGKRTEMVRAIVDCEIPVMGHLGLIPQSVNVMGGFKVQGRKVDEALRLLDDAHRLQEASCFALVLEGTPAELTARVSDSLTIPTIGIGSGPDCSEQVLCFMTCWAKPKVIAPNSFPPIRKAFSSSMMRFRAGQRMSAVARSPARKSPIGFPKALGRQLPTGRHPPQIITSVAELRRTLAKSRSANQRAGLCRRWAISTMATWR